MVIDIRTRQQKTFETVAAQLTTEPEHPMTRFNHTIRNAVVDGECGGADLNDMASALIAVLNLVHMKLLSKG